MRGRSLAGPIQHGFRLSTFAFGTAISLPPCPPPSSLLTLPRSQNRHRNREHHHRQLKPSKSPLNRPWCPWLRELCQYISPQRVKRRFHVPSRVGPLARMLLARTHALPRPRPFVGRRLVCSGLQHKGSKYWEAIACIGWLNGADSHVIKTCHKRDWNVTALSAKKTDRHVKTMRK